MILSEDEVKRLTKRKKHYKQIEALRYMKIPFKVRPDGSLVVTEEAAYGKAEEERQTSPAMRPLPPRRVSLR